MCATAQRQGREAAATEKRRGGGEGGGVSWSGILIGQDLPSEPATCMLYCAIALGALVRGQPLEHVSNRVVICVEQAGGWSLRAWGKLPYLSGIVFYRVRGELSMSSRVALLGFFSSFAICYILRVR